MTLVLQFVPRPTGSEPNPDRLDLRDVYDFDSVDLDAHAGISISSACDQRFLADRSAEISAWVRRGGRLMVTGHPISPFVDGMPKFRKLDFHGQEDLWLYPTGEHPIWAGLDREQLIFNTGVPGEHSLERLQEIGVAGFYAHAYLVDLPEGATTITGIGPGRLPVDVSYPLGDGEVIVHLGNDLMVAGMGTTIALFHHRVLSYLENAPIRKALAR